MLNQATLYNVEHQKSDLRADGYLLTLGGSRPTSAHSQERAEVGLFHYGNCPSLGSIVVEA